MEIRPGLRINPMKTQAQDGPVVNSGIAVGLSRRSQIGVAAEVKAEEASMQPGESYGEWLKRVIKKKRLNAPTVQTKTGIHRSSIFKIMTGDRIPSAGTMAALMVGLDLSDEAILQTTREVGRRTIAHKKATNKNDS